MSCTICYQEDRCTIFLEKVFIYTLIEISEFQFFRSVQWKTPNNTRHQWLLSKRRKNENHLLFNAMESCSKWTSNKPSGISVWKSGEQSRPLSGEVSISVEQQKIRSYTLSMYGFYFITFHKQQDQDSNPWHASGKHCRPGNESVWGM